MIGYVFQPIRSTSASPVLANFTPMISHGCFFISFKDAFEVVRSLRSQGYRAVVHVTNPNYSI
jgi:hypothetical protein